MAEIATPAVEKPVMVVGVDDSEHSDYTLQWTLQQFFSSAPGHSPFKLVIIHAKPQAVTSVSFAGPGINYSFQVLLQSSVILLSQEFMCFVCYFEAAVVLPYVDNDSTNTAACVVDKAKQLCLAKSVLTNTLPSFDLNLDC